MIVQKGKYRLNNLKFIKSLYDRNHTDISKLISQASVATGVPCIVVAHFIGEMHGYSEEVNSNIDSLMKFYGYSQVIE